MDQNNFPDNTNNKNDDFFINFNQNIEEVHKSKEQKVDAFFDRVEGTQKSNISDAPKRPEGERYVTKDSEVVVFRSGGEKGGYTYKAEPKPAPRERSKPVGVTSSDDKKKLFGKKADATAQQPKNEKTGGNGGGKPPKPAKKKSKVGAVFATIGKTILGLGCLAVIAVCVLAVLGSVYLVNVTKDDDKILNLNNIELSMSSSIMVEHVVDEISGETKWVEHQRIAGSENRLWIEYDRIPDDVINALVASEDKRFWEHSGVDWKRTIAAFVSAYVPGAESLSTGGGSTIVQQLIKNLTDEDDVSGFDGALRKLREIYRALVMEKNYSREQILEAYLNTFRLSGKVAGIETAANYYFSKTTEELTAAEAAAIVCITKAPGAYNPFNYPEENKIQRDYILKVMHDEGYLDQAQYAAAQDESNEMVFGEPNEVTEGNNIYDYFTDTVINEVMNDMVEHADEVEAWNGITNWNEAFNIFANGGYHVRATMDPKVQAVMENVGVNGRETEDDERGKYSSSNEDGYIYPIYGYVYTEIVGRKIITEEGETILDTDPSLQRYVKNSGWSSSYSANDEGTYVRDYTQPQSSFVVMNFEGEIKGIIGGLGEKTESLGVNRAVDTTRSTGSSMKPLAGYGPAIQQSVITFSDLIPDQPLPAGTIPGTTGEWPRNYDRTYGPPVTVAEGLARSLNTTAVHVLRFVGTDFSLSYMKSFLGLDSLDDTGDNTHSLVLGGLYKGVSTLDMCAAYAPFGNGGWYYSPHSYTEILDANGNVVFSKTAYIDRIRAFDEASAYIMNRLLRNVMYSGLSGTGVNARPSGDMEYVGKSGTHTDNIDYWFIGMNPYYVMAVWQGYGDVQVGMESPRPHPVQLCFRKVMTDISADLEAREFNAPEDGSVVKKSYCRVTGLLAADGCDPRTGYYKADVEGGVPRTCNHAVDSLVANMPEEEPAA